MMVIMINKMNITYLFLVIFVHYETICINAGISWGYDYVEMVSSPVVQVDSIS